MSRPRPVTPVTGQPE